MSDPPASGDGISSRAASALFLSTELRPSLNHREGCLLMKHGIVWPGAPPVKAPGLLFSGLPRGPSHPPTVDGCSCSSRERTDRWMRRIQPHRLCLVHWSWMLQSFSGPGCNLLYLSNPVQLPYVTSKIDGPYVRTNNLGRHPFHTCMLTPLLQWFLKCQSWVS